MHTCGPSCCHDHQQEQQQHHRHRHRLPTGTQRFLNKLAGRKLLRPEPFNYINLKPNYRPTLLSVITNAHETSLALRPPLPPVPLHHQFGTFISGYSLPGETERNVKTRETWLLLPPWPFRFSFYHSLHSSCSPLPLLIHSPPHCLSLFILSSTLWGASGGSSEPRLCKQSSRDEEQRCCTRNSEARKLEAI